MIFFSVFSVKGLLHKCLFVSHSLFIEEEVLDFSQGSQEELLGCLESERLQRGDKQGGQDGVKDREKDRVKDRAILICCAGPTLPSCLSADAARCSVAYPSRGSGDGRVIHIQAGVGVLGGPAAVSPAAGSPSRQPPPFSLAPRGSSQSSPDCCDE